ncbi:MAG TPA: hypothetical protein VEU74_07140 [Gemmatimonadales bacterium]|nr:hypothetical protein [Gemmatimonadales bacterium]
MTSSSIPLLSSQRDTFRAVAMSVVPEAAELDAADWEEAERIVARAIAARPARVQRQLALLLRCLEWIPLLRYGHRLSRLDPARRARFLDSLQTSRLLLVRRGVWGLRTLVLKGYYGRPAAVAAIGYRADPRGWEARR